MMTSKPPTHRYYWAVTATTRNIWSHTWCGTADGVVALLAAAKTMTQTSLTHSRLGAAYRRQQPAATVTMATTRSSIWSNRKCGCSAGPRWFLSATTKRRSRSHKRSALLLGATYAAGHIRKTTPKALPKAVFAGDINLHNMALLQYGWVLVIWEEG